MSWKTIYDKIPHIQSVCQGKRFMVKFPMYNCTCAVTIEYQGRVFTVAMYNKPIYSD